MNIKFTARHFRPRAHVRQHALDEVRRLGKFYDGIVSAEVILSYERAVNSVKTAEVNLSVYGTVLSVKERSEDYLKSITLACSKLGLRLKKYKSKLRDKGKITVRAARAKV